MLNTRKNRNSLEKGRLRENTIFDNQVNKEIFRTR